MFPKDDQFFSLSDSDLREALPSKDQPKEFVRHLVQDEELIANIHNEELPPGLYYEELRDVLAKSFPKSTLQAREHAVALCAAFDTASAFGLSFGVKKFQFMQKWVKLVGEIVGEMVGNRIQR